MIWVRSYPQNPPAGRSWVVDTHARPFLMTDYDYRDLITLDDDICLLEWDVVASREDMLHFEECAAENPGSVLVAPYLLYNPDAAPHYAHRNVAGNGAEQWVTAPHDHITHLTDCDYFGFGMIYLPRDLIRQFLDAPAPARGRSPFLLPEQEYTDTRLTDQTFSVWHRHTLDRRALVCWDVRPIHLNY